MSKILTADDLLDELADEAWSLTRQRDIDDEADKRRASGYSPEELSIQDAYMEGQRAGSLQTAAGLNPFSDPASPHYQAWERGRSAAEGYRRNRRAA